MEFLKVAKRRSLWSEIVYIGLNLLLALAILVVVIAINSPVPAFALVLLSKWRVLAVRPRYWFVNIQSNMVDIIVSLSLVVLLSAASGAIVAQVIITALYAFWLLALKPRTKRSLVVAQAGIGVFVGVMALVTVSYDWYAFVVVVGFWLIGYNTAKHVLSAYNHEAHLSLLSLLWAFVIAEIGWLTYHWTIAYDLIGTGHIKLPQVAVFAFILSFLAERVYNSYAKYGEVRSQDILLPTLLSVSVVLVLVIFFNDISTSLG
ncbi:MAG: hypothetical protein ABJA64_02660 [Candidatus Saccharibacteria bacterium]